MPSPTSLLRLRLSAPPVLIASRRCFTTTPLLRLKEDKAQSSAEIEKAKQEQLRSGDRKRELESHSEENIKAEQQHGKIQDHEEHIEDLQKETAGKSEAEKGR